MSENEQDVQYTSSLKKRKLELTTQISNLECKYIETEQKMKKIKLKILYKSLKLGETLCKYYVKSDPHIESFEINMDVLCNIYHNKDYNNVFSIRKIKEPLWILKLNTFGILCCSIEGMLYKNVGTMYVFEDDEEFKSAELSRKKSCYYKATTFKRRTQKFAKICNREQLYSIAKLMHVASTGFQYVTQLPFDFGPSIEGDYIISKETGNIVLNSFTKEQKKWFDIFDVAKYLDNI